MTKLFYVVGEHKGLKAYYVGWWNTYSEPLFTHHPSLGAKPMKAKSANRVRRRLENPEIWGGVWNLEEATLGNINDRSTQKNME